MNDPVTMEIWKSVRYFEGLYEVSSLGRVRSLPGGRRHGKILFTGNFNPKKQYPAASLHRGGRQYRKLVHLMVAEAFLPPKPSAEHEVRHLSGERSNCAEVNLRWGTAAENARDRDRHGRTVRGTSHGLTTLAEKDIVAIRTSAAPQRQIARQFGVSQSTVRRILRREVWSHVE